LDGAGERFVTVTALEVPLRVFVMVLNAEDTLAVQAFLPSVASSVTVTELTAELPLFTMAKAW
jgi:hypothetical protein